jgi:hypothetical protein
MNHPQLPCAAALSASARAAEITTILAAAIGRSVLGQAPVGLGFVPGSSVHTTPYQQEKL